MERSCELQTHTCIIQTPWWNRPVCTRKKRDQVTAEQVWNVRCLLTITEDRVAFRQQIDHLSFNCFLKLPLQCLLVCLFKAMGMASMLFPSTQIFITVPREDSEGFFAQLDYVPVTLHFELPDPLKSEHQHPVGASCHRGSISPSGSCRNSSL